jgi:hypothetical protein
LLRGCYNPRGEFLITVSLETVKIVRALPQLGFQTDS